MKIRVEYETEKEDSLDTKLENEIIIFMGEELGLHFYASGFDLISGVRDLCFDNRE